MRVKIILENQFRWPIKHSTHGFKNKKVRLAGVPQWSSVDL